MDGRVKHSPLALANTFIERHAGSAGITHMKVQKLCYYAHGWWLAFENEPFLTERPQVWKFGPVFASLYAALAHHGSRRSTALRKRGLMRQHRSYPTRST